MAFGFKTECRQETSDKNSVVVLGAMSRDRWDGNPAVAVNGSRTQVVVGEHV